MQERRSAAARRSWGGCPAQSPQGSLAILAAIIGYDGNVYQTAGMTAESSYARFAPSLESCLLSFHELTEKRPLALQPDKQTPALPHPGGNETLGNISESQPQSGIRLEELTLINRLEPDQILQPGTMIELVREGR